MYYYYKSDYYKSVFLFNRKIFTTNTVSVQIYKCLYRDTFAGQMNFVINA